MLKKTLAAAAVMFGTSLLAAVPASAAPGYATTRLEVRAGPDFDYPTVGVARAGSRIEINGCLPDWRWCDVTTRRDRGWVRGEDIQAEYRGRRLSYGSPWRVPVFSFNFGTYWDNHYRGRPFYGERTRWERHWRDHDRGPRRGPDHHRDGRGDGRYDDRRGDRHDDRRDWDDRRDR